MVSAHPANGIRVAPTLQLLTISLAKPFVSNTTQFSLFIQTPLQLTGEAWPACRAILTLQLLTISNYLASPSPALPALANLASLGSHSHTVSYRYRYRMTYTLMRLDIRARGYHMTWHMANPYPGDASGRWGNSTFSFKHHLTGEPVLPLGQCPPSKRYTLYLQHCNC